MCIMDVNAEHEIENYHVVGHNAQTVLTDMDTVISLERDDNRKRMLEVIRSRQQEIVDDVFAVYGKLCCSEKGVCGHDHKRSLEGQPGNVQRLAEANLAAARAKISEDSSEKPVKKGMPHKAML